MTTYKPYNPNKPIKPKPSTVEIGVSLITREVEDLIQDNRHVQVPVDEEIIYLRVDYNIVHTKSGETDYDKIALLAEENGYHRKHWQVMDVWEVIPPEQQPF